jgi:hypothetical protein
MKQETLEVIARLLPDNFEHAAAVLPARDRYILGD